jgi:hypothetical protein
MGWSFADGFFNFADPFLNLAGLLLRCACAFQVGVIRGLADRFFDFPLHFVELAFGAVLGAGFHGALLFGAELVFLGGKWAGSVVALAGNLDLFGSRFLAGLTTVFAAALRHAFAGQVCALGFFGCRHHSFSLFVGTLGSASIKLWAWERWSELIVTSIGFQRRALTTKGTKVHEGKPDFGARVVRV